MIPPLRQDTRRVMFNFILIFSVAVGLSSLAQELKPYAYLAKNVPAISGENCHSQAKQLAQKFSKITGWESTGTCQAIRPEGNEILIRYNAPEAVEKISSVPDLDFPGRGYEFSTKSECEAELANESSVFQKNIGADPLLVFCHSRENYYGLRRWALVLEGFGKTKSPLAWSSSLVPGCPSAKQIENIRRAAKEKLIQEGLDVRFVFIQEDERGHLRLNALYYGQYNEQLKGFSLASVNTLDQCFQALQDFEKLETNHPEISSVASCINNPYSRGADLFVVANVLRWFDLRHAAESFKTYEECQSDKNRLVDFYKKEVSPAVLEGFCTEWGPEWKVNLVQVRLR